MPMVNTLTGSAGFKLGPVLFETLVKHYFERVGTAQSEEFVQLRKDEILYDEAFNVVKTFLDVSTRHTVEELQAFSNVRTPSPPWVHLVRLVIPMSCCDQAADYLIKALGGPEVCNRVVGGTKWWQVRGRRGLDAEWITAKKDWQEAKRRYKAKATRTGSMPQTPPVTVDTEEEDTYRPDMDTMRCILYSHGGGYYFGSVDQERYAIQRLGRKINGRVLAVNYRLAPQYPFPCAIQDVIAAYLYLIRPPEGASHTAVKPEHIIVAGDSAGGGLTLAMLQVCRDSDLPLPSCAVLVSPWCDMTHSFPSIHLNTSTDIIPLYGLSLYKPSTLWPPPSDELTERVHSNLKSRIRNMARLDTHDPSPIPTVQEIPFEGDVVLPKSDAEIAGQGLEHATRTGDGDTQEPERLHDEMHINVGATGPLPAAAATHATSTAVPSTGSSPIVRLTAQDGSELVIESQIQLYVPNDLLVHPLVSPALSYLGGLPPMLFIEGDKEVLRDEGIYTAHKAADPSKYPIRDEQRDMYPALKGIEEKYGPSQVHLQVYDDCPHVLPILFSFTQPAKFAYRAMATFIRHVTGLPTMRPAPSVPQELVMNGQRDFLGGLSLSNESGNAPSRRKTILGVLRRTASATGAPSVPEKEQPLEKPSEVADMPAIVDGAVRPTARRASSLTVTNAARNMLRHASFRKRPGAPSRVSEASETEKRPANILAEPMVETPEGSPRAYPLTPPPLPERGSSLPSLSERLASDTSSEPTAGPSEPRRLWASPPSSPRTRGFSSPAKQPSEGSDVAGPRFEPAQAGSVAPRARQAGDPVVYEDTETPWANMIRERVSTQGVIRPLEPASELSAMNVPADMIGIVSELAARRYIAGRTKFDHKFRREIKSIHRARQKNLAAARKDASSKKTMSQLQAALFQDSDTQGQPGPSHGEKRMSDGLSAIANNNWTLAWALEQERPPPSSLVARRDTQEARALARIADFADESAMSGNNLWGILMTFLTLGPDNSKGAAPGDRLADLENQANPGDASDASPAKPARSKSRRLKEKLSLSFLKGK